MKTVLSFFCAFVLVMSLQAQSIKSVEVLPKKVTLKAGVPVQFSLLVHLDDGSVVTPQKNVKWFATGGIVNSKGHFTAGKVDGSYAVTAMVGSYRASANVTVQTTKPRVAKIVILGKSPKLGTGQSYQFKAMAFSRDMQPVPFTPIWQTTGGGTIDQNGKFTATKTGEFMVLVRGKGLPEDLVDTRLTKIQVLRASVDTTDDKNLLTEGAIAKLVIQGKAPVLNVGQTHVFRAKAYDKNGKEVYLSPKWQATGGAISSRSGFFRATEKGTFYVILKAEGSDISTRQVVYVGVKPTVTEKEDEKEEDKPVTAAPKLKINTWDVGGGNFFTPKAKATVTVTGKGAAEVRMYRIDNNGKKEIMQRFKVLKDGEKFNFSRSYVSFQTKQIGVDIVDDKGKVLAKYAKDVN